MNDDASGTYETIGQTAFKTTMLKSGLFDYSDYDIMVKEIVLIIGSEEAGDAATDKNGKRNRQTKYRSIIETF